MSLYYDDERERRRIWFERGMLSPEEYWRGLTNEERDAAVMQEIANGDLAKDDPVYVDYYERRTSGRAVRGSHSPEILARFPWLED